MNEWEVIEPAKKFTMRKAQTMAPLGGAGRSVFLLLSIAVALLVAERANLVSTLPIRAAVSDAMEPVLITLRQPVTAFENVVANIGSLHGLYEDNLLLREENARLLAWQTAAQRLERENAALRALTHFGAPDRPTVLSARVIAGQGGPFLHTVLIDAGEADGLAVGDAVLDAAGLIGRIVQPGQSTARVLLITDLNSKIPVLIERTGSHAILNGTNGPRPSLVFGEELQNLVPGDRIVTSGDGSLLPADLPLGEVEKIDDRSIWIRPYAQLNRLEFVRIVHHLVPSAPQDLRPGRI